MRDIKEYIQSGILEMYVLGLTSAEENTEVAQMMAKHDEIAEELDRITEALIVPAESENVSLDPTIKPLVMATIDYQERLKNGEAVSFPPALNQGAKKEDYSEWLNRKDLQLEGDDLEDISLRIIGYTPGMLTGILWLKHGAPYEIHDKEIEKFLILEGSCDIVMDDKVDSLKPGDYYSIPLHLGHSVKVTSNVPCKAILQRVAA